MREHNFVIHIGYPKCASTFLQSTVFSGSDERIKVLRHEANLSSQIKGGAVKSGYWLFDSNVEIYKGNKESKRLNPFAFSVNEARRDLDKRLDKNANLTCMSNEAWVGYPFIGGTNSKEYADRIQAVAPNAKIVIVIRNQIDMILSMYAHFLVSAGGICSLNNFLRHGNKDISQTYPSNMEFFCYSYLCEYYQKRFGKENVLIIPFEKLKIEGEHSFLSTVYKFLRMPDSDFEFNQVDTNTRNYKNYIAIRLLPIINLFSVDHPAIGGIGWGKLYKLRSLYLKIMNVLIPQKLEKKIIRNQKKIISRQVGHCFVEDNKKLQKVVDFDLNKYGFDLE